MNSALRHPADTSAVTVPERLGLSLLARRTAVRIRPVGKMKRGGGGAARRGTARHGTARHGAVRCG
eukprot:2221675-Prymnesium_polylepis.1